MYKKKLCTTKNYVQQKTHTKNYVQQKTHTQNYVQQKTQEKKITQKTKSHKHKITQEKLITVRVGIIIASCHPFIINNPVFLSLKPSYNSIIR